MVTALKDGHVGENMESNMIQKHIAANFKDGLFICGICNSTSFRIELSALVMHGWCVKCNKWRFRLDLNIK